MMAKDLFFVTVEHMQVVMVEIDEIGVVVTVEITIEEEVFTGIGPEVGTRQFTVGGHIKQLACDMGGDVEYDVSYSTGFGMIVRLKK